MLSWLHRKSAESKKKQLELDQTNGATIELHSPKLPIALALGGGSARGWAHIGVLRALKEADVPISMIAGTSIGALVGGCYLAGKLDELESFARSLTRRRMVSLMDITFRGNGLFGGMKLDKQLRQHLDGILIEDLPLPFVAVATELRTGHEIWLSSGSLINAMRASYALPGVFEPVRYDRRLLVDGALVNPVPVSVCRAHEESLVVAVNLHYDQFGRAAVVRYNKERAQSDQITKAIDSKSRLGITTVMMEAFNIIQDRISRARMAGDPPDITLMPSIGHVGLIEFHRAGEIIDIGYQETLKHIDTIRRMQDSPY